MARTKDQHQWASLAKMQCNHDENSAPRSCHGYIRVRIALQAESNGNIMNVYLKWLLWPGNPEQLAEMTIYALTHIKETWLQKVTDVLRVMWLSEACSLLMSLEVLVALNFSCQIYADINWCILHLSYSWLRSHATPDRHGWQICVGSTGVNIHYISCLCCRTLLPGSDRVVTVLKSEQVWQSAQGHVVVTFNCCLL